MQYNYERQIHLPSIKGDYRKLAKERGFLSYSHPRTISSVEIDSRPWQPQLAVFINLIEVEGEAHDQDGKVRTERWVTEEVTATRWWLLKTNEDDPDPELEWNCVEYSEFIEDRYEWY
jgi:hypothetical protein